MIIALIASIKGLHLSMSYLYDNVSPIAVVAACAIFYGVSVVLDRMEREQ